MPDDEERPDEGEWRRELRAALIRGASALLSIGTVLAVQWWVTTPEAERAVAFARLGLTHCRARRWHVRRRGIEWPRHCACEWRPGSFDDRLAADRAESAASSRFRSAKAPPG